MNYICISLGTNLGDRLALMKEMENLVKKVLHPPFKMSKLMETEPIGVPDTQEWFYNRILVGTYQDSPFRLLEECQQIEITLGRTDKNRLMARTSDIDILLFGKTIVTSTNLTIPHAQLLFRRFCLEGINDCIPSLIHPILNKTISTLVSAIPKSVKNQKIRYV